MVPELAAPVWLAKNQGGSPYPADRTASAEPCFSGPLFLHVRQRVRPRNAQNEKKQPWEKEASNRVVEKGGFSILILILPKPAGAQWD
jgi:hypothetical protein